MYMCYKAVFTMILLLLIWCFPILPTSTVESSSTSNQHSLVCKVYNTTTLDCSRRNFKKIPLLKGDNIHLTSLKTLDISHNKLGYINDNTFAGLNELESLYLSYQETVVLQGRPFYHSPLLKNLTIDNCQMNIGILPLEVFSGLNELQELDLSHNYASSPVSIPEMLFANLSSLQHLNLYYTGLRTCPENVFMDLINLRYLDLGNNVIESLPVTLFANLTSLEHLDLSVNMLSNIPDTLFAGLAQLQYLNISYNILTTTPCKALENLKVLSKLGLSSGWNQLDWLTCSIKKLSTLRELVISSSFVQTYSQREYWNEARWLNLMTKLPDFLFHVTIETYSEDVVFQSVISPSYNSSSISMLTVIVPWWCASSLLHLSIQDDAFSMFPNLQNLSIQNRCEIEKKSAELSNNIFRGLPHLASLELIGIGLTEFPGEALRGLLANSLKYLDISNNNIKDIRFSHPVGQHSLTTLDVSKNPVQSFDFFLTTHAYLMDVEPDSKEELAIYTQTPSKELRSLYISAKYTTKNLYFDKRLCYSFPMIEKVTFGRLNFRFPFWLTTRFWGNCSCMKSLNIYNSPELDSDFHEDVDSFPYLEQLVMTNCKLDFIKQILLQSGSLQFMNFSNNNIASISGNDFSSLINLKQLDLSYNKIQIIPVDKFQHMSQLTYLNLAGNYIADLNVLRDVRSLQTLIVFNNALPTLPSFLMKESYNLQHLGFGENSFSCECYIEPLQDWILTDVKTFIDPQPPYICKSPASKGNLCITEFSLDCRIHLEYYIPPSLASLLVICVIVATIYKYQWLIHYKLWRLFYQRRYQRYIDNDDDADIINDDDEDDVDAREAPIMRRRYHAYVSYHRDNEDWVNDQLIRITEDGPEQFKLCLKERGDIPAGHYILNAICHGIKQSRKTIAVLSENFMEDGWCHYQLHFARMRMVLDNVDVLILVQIGEIPERSKTLLLRQLLCYKEVLKWPENPDGQELFWNKLKMELRKPARLDRRIQV